MFSEFMSMFESDDAPQPHDVAQAIDKLIDTPAGKRPARIVVGNSFGADSINQSTKPIQFNAVNALGLDHLDAIKIS